MGNTSFTNSSKYLSDTRSVALLKAVIHIIDRKTKQNKKKTNKQKNKKKKNKKKNQKKQKNKKNKKKNKQKTIDLRMPVTLEITWRIDSSKHFYKLYLNWWQAVILNWLLNFAKHVTDKIFHLPVSSSHHYYPKLLYYEEKDYQK